MSHITLWTLVNNFFFIFFSFIFFKRIFLIWIKGKLEGSDVNLFATDAALTASYATAFTPTFTDIIKSSVSTAELDAIKLKCSNNEQCITDTLLTGNSDFGTNTLKSVQTVDLQNKLQGK